MGVDDCFRSVGPPCKTGSGFGLGEYPFKRPEGRISGYRMSCNCAHLEDLSGAQKLGEEQGVQKGDG